MISARPKTSFYFLVPAGISICTVLFLGEAFVRAASPLLPFMPRAEDFTFLWWANGPQHFLGMNRPPPEAVLCMQSGLIGLAIDTKLICLLHAGRFARPLDRQSALSQGNAAVFALPQLPLELSIQRGGRKFTCVGRGDLPKDDFYFPVRFIESGRFFQRISIEGLEFGDAAGGRLEAKGRVELALWPDRAVLSFELEKAATTADGELWIITPNRRSSRPLSAGGPAVLQLFGPDDSQRPFIETESGIQTSTSVGTACTVLKLPALTWKNAKGTYYPEEELDRLDRWRFTLRNESDQEIAAPIMFVDEHPSAITGFTPLLCDADGTPTGIPVQISKNWHQREDKGDLPHQGPWFHGCTFLRMPPHTKRDFLFAVTYARYGGVPAASHSQLCLIGWGHNQFWDQAAIGSFGESICYEPGRVQRRCAIDDIRPLMTLPSAEAKPYGWAGNCGGGDFLVWFDDAGQYGGFRETRADYLAYGPCLTDVRYVEETAGGEIGARVNVSIARSDDYLRAFHHLQYDVQKPVRWQRLAFCQLGADFYNDTPARLVAIGDAGGLREEWEPARGKDVYDRRGIALSGPQPWLSIHGIERAAVQKGGTVASRGLIVRSWKAKLGGKACPEPHASFYATEWGKGNFRTTVELSPPPNLTALQPGDFVEAELELVVFPADAQAYYGPNAAFRKALERDADTWHLVQREAAGNALRVTTTKGRVERHYPLVLSVNRKNEAAFNLLGGLGFVPVTFTGLHDSRGLDLWVDGHRLDQSVHGNDFWQTDYDEARRQWSLTFNVPRTGRGSSRLELRRNGR